MLHANSQALVDALECLPLLAGRFSDIQFVNYDAATAQKRGHFSLIFSALDATTGLRVALKFYDLHPAVQNDIYRRQSFRREHEILNSLRSATRCLQVASDVLTYDLPAGGGRVTPCEYFAVQWLDEDVDDYFLDQVSHQAIAKLRLFNEIVLAVGALHTRFVFHRDVKAENLRAYRSALKMIVVAIDLGTAARIDSGYLARNYGGQVGDYNYSPPEAICGLAANRRIAHLCDVYSLGCLLFELFNHDTYYDAIRTINPKLDLRFASMSLPGLNAADEEAQVVMWQSANGKLLSGIARTGVEFPNHSCPPSIVQLISELVDALCHPNFALRPKLEWVRQRLWIAIHVLENEKLSAKRLALNQQRRKRRSEVALATASRQTRAN